MALYDGLIAYWKFDGDANDETENGHDGTYVGTPAEVAGLRGTALDLDPGDQIAVAAHADFKFNADKTVSGWWKRHGTSFASAIITKGVPASLEWGLLFSNSFSSELIYMVAGNVVYTNGVVPSVDEWNMLGIEFDLSANAVRFRINEDVSAWQISGVPLTLNDDPLYWNNDDGAYTGHDNALDNWAVWDRLLTESEWYEWYGGGAGYVITLPVTRALKIGDGSTFYRFPDGWKVVEDDFGYAVPASKLALAHGASIQRGYRDGAMVQIEGGFYKGPLDTSEIRPRIDLFRTALAKAARDPETWGRLYLYTDRFYRDMRPERAPHSYQPTAFNRFTDIRLGMKGPDPYMYSHTLRSRTWTVTGTAQSDTVSVGGDAVDGTPWVVLTITVDGAGDQTIDFHFTNAPEDGDSQAFDLAGDVQGGDEIVIDCLRQTVTIEGEDRMDLFTGQWFRFFPGDNELGETYDATAMTSVLVEWRVAWE